jgi:hypothetical protein
MEYTEFKNTTDKLKLKVIKRMVIVAFGVIGLCLLFSIIPLLAYSGRDAGPDLGEPQLVEAPNRPNSMDQGQQPIAPIAPDAIAQPQQIVDKHSFVGTLIPLAILLTVLTLMAYGTYDTIRLFMQYRLSKEREEMFP